MTSDKLGPPATTLECWQFAWAPRQAFDPYKCMCQGVAGVCRRVSLTCEQLNLDMLGL